MSEVVFGAEAREGSAGPPGEPRADPAGGTAMTRTEMADRLVAELFRAHRAALVRVAVLLVGDTPTAEDVVQEAFIGLYRAQRRPTGTENALAYVRASVVNGCRSVHRTRSRALRRAVQYAPPVWSAEAAVLAREESRATLQAFSKLPGRAREVLALRYYLDLPDAEIATTLGISKSTVSSTASRALSALAAEMMEGNS
jgi:RNA polymerase sigma factor (sigma-70 family)